MTDFHKPKSLSQGSFNTLAQNGTVFSENQGVFLQGNGSNLSNVKSIKSKARRKIITQKMVLTLLDASKKQNSTEMQKGYWNSYHCQGKLTTANGRVYGKYCKNRFCTLCSANRKADILNRYLPVIQTWEQPFFVTLTLKSVSFFQLNSVMKSMTKGFRSIVETYRKRNLRGKGIKLIGIRSLESNFNPRYNWYNPHFHCIVANKKMAEIIVKEWLNRSKKNWTNKGGQKMEPVFNNLSALIEVVKYGSKIFTEPDVRKKTKGKGPRKIYVAALNNIFTSMKGLRIFERFGFDLPKPSESVTSVPTLAKEYSEWLFHPDFFDWLNLETGNALTNYQPPCELLDLLENCTDTDQE